MRSVYVLHDLHHEYNNIEVQGFGSKHFFVIMPFASIVLQHFLNCMVGHAENVPHI